MRKSRFLSQMMLILASAADEIPITAASAVALDVPSDPAQPIPNEFVWMPAGTHEIVAHLASGGTFKGKVVCDEAGARAVQATFDALRAAGFRVPLDKDHKDEEATAWVNGFKWDPLRGIIVAVEWTSLGEKLLRGRVYRSFSPAFNLNRKTSRVASFPGGGHAAGGLVNAPAFGAAMPALIAARLAGADSVNPASGGSPGTQQNSHMNKELLIAILAALAVQHSADATEEQLTQLLAAHKDKLTEACTSNAELKAKADQLAAIQAKAATDGAELVALRAKDQARRKEDAKKAVDAAVARGAIPAKDETVQAKWRGLIEDDPNHAELLAAMPGNPALTRVTQPGGFIVTARDGLVEALRGMAKVSPVDTDQRALIYAKDVAPIFAKEPQFSLGPILAANSLGTLSGELITQRSLTLLKRSFPALFAISTDFSSDAAAFNQVLKTRLRTIPTVGAYNADTGYPTANAGTVDVPITIDAHNAVQIAFGANELGATNRDLFGEQVEGAHNAIGADLIDALLAVITVANFPTPANTSAIALANFNRAAVSGISKKLTDRKVAKAGRFLMLNTDYYDKLGQDASIVSLATFQQAQIITEGELPRVAKMQPYEVEAFPTVGNLVGFAGTPDALAVATRVPNDYTAAMPDVPSNGVVQIVKNPDTGVSVMLVRFVDHQLGKSFWRLAYMRGAGKGQVASGERIISAAP